LAVLCPQLVAASRRPQTVSDATSRCSGSTATTADGCHRRGQTTPAIIAAVARKR